MTDNLDEVLEDLVGVEAAEKNRVKLGKVGRFQISAMENSNNAHLHLSQCFVFGPTLVVRQMSTIAGPPTLGRP